MNAGCQKLKISPEGCQLVLEEDGTEIDEDSDIIRHARSTFITFILLAKDQCWSSSSSASTTSAPASPMGHSQTGSQNTSKSLVFYSC